MFNPFLGGYSARWYSCTHTSFHIIYQLIFKYQEYLKKNTQFDTLAPEHKLLPQLSITRDGTAFETERRFLTAFTYI